MVLDVVKHYPVLLNELISIITPQRGGTFIDCTFGQGGYTKKILSFEDTKVIALDRDSQTKKKADDVLDQFKNRFIFKNKRFSQLGDLKVKNENIKAIIFDLGYSYSQIKDPTKGLSFNSVGDLNMQMGINEFSAKEVVNNLSVVELEKIFKFFGEEKEAKKIANQIEIKRKKKEIDTQCLVELIEKTKIVNTTTGRALISEILPKNIPYSFIDQDLNKKAISKLFDVAYRLAGLKETVLFADQIKNMGFKYSTLAGVSIGVDDMVIPKEKTTITAKAEKEVKT